VDWRAWHEEYADPNSALGRRLAVVQREIRSVLDRAPAGALRTISVCAGQGHDLIGVLVDHPRRTDVSARLVELDSHNAEVAREASREARLDRVEVVVTDAAVTDAYIGAVPANVVLLCGVFGNITASDIAKTVRHLPSLCAADAGVIWTRHRHPPDLAPLIRETFAEHGLEEVAFESSPPFGVGVNRLMGGPRPFEPGVRLFEFVGYEVLQPAFHATQHGDAGGDSPRSQR
jgi:hypothetical protein